MHIVVNEELKAYIDPLTPDEYESLERSLLTEGCRDALVLWGDTLVDGHNRYGICRKHDIPFQTVQNERFRSIDDVHLWMIEQHLGRRSVSDFQRGVLALRKREILTERRQRAAENGGVETPDVPFDVDDQRVEVRLDQVMPIGPRRERAVVTPMRAERDVDVDAEVSVVDRGARSHHSARSIIGGPHRDPRYRGGAQPPAGRNSRSSASRRCAT